METQAQIPQTPFGTLTLPEIARSTLFDYEARGKSSHYQVFYDDPDYEASVEGIRYGLTDAFYTGNKPLMDLLCLTFRLFVETKTLRQK